MTRFHSALCVSAFSLLLNLSFHAGAAGVKWFDGKSPVSVSVRTGSDLVVGTAVDMFSDDMEAVTGLPARKVKGENAAIQVYQLDKASKSVRDKLSKMNVPVERLDSLTDGFNITVADGKIHVIGSNGRGAAYGILELSRKAGVSPWIWWGDMTPAKKSSLEIADGYCDTQGASVEFRGIFINDEDWSLRPWSANTFEPGNGSIGPKTYKEVFKLLMRLRGNAIWPAMHPGTEAFFKNPANKLIADSCGIAVGTSHCEPLLRNNVGEWDVKERGAFNYITNRDAVRDYWTERLDEVRGSSGGNMFTIGMRGIHDGSMEGVKTEEEKFAALQRVIDDQQKLIGKHIGDPSKQMQVFVPYKEVLDLYEKGLKVPEYVMLMWCDDNYGYITRLSTPEEQTRPGGGGVYYHLSYWGRPHDHLWLTTTQPGLIYNEMRSAYDHNARRLWIANVHDPKAAAYDLTLFLDMAWDIDSVKSESVGEHLRKWLKDNFGESAGERLYPAMRKYYQLCAMRKPEFMGWNQVELDKRIYNRGISPSGYTEFSFSEFGGEADRYMEEYEDVARVVKEVSAEIAPELADAYFAAIEYPVTCAANQSVKILEAQRARSLAGDGSGKNPERRSAAVALASAKSQEAYQNIIRLTDRYNNGIAGGKWKYSMNMRPRELPFAQAPSLPTLLDDAGIRKALASEKPGKRHAVSSDGAVARNAADFTSSKGETRLVDMLGHSGRSLELDPGAEVTYVFEVSSSMRSPELTVALIPTQPSDGGKERFAVSVDGGEPVEFDLKEPFRSEQWKLNVLRGQAVRKLPLPELSEGHHTLTIKSVDPHIVLDQWMIDPKSSRKHYLIPIAER